MQGVDPCGRPSSLYQCPSHGYHVRYHHMARRDAHYGLARSAPSSDSQDKENIVSGLHCSAGAVHYDAAACGNDGTQHDLAHALDGGAVKAHNGSSGSNELALNGKLLESLAL